MIKKPALLHKSLVIGVIFLFIIMSIGSSTSHIGKGSFIHKSNNPPYEPSDPIPPDGATNVSIYTGLCWTGGDPDGDEVLYDVYFGNYTPPPPILNNITYNCSTPPGYIEFNTTYYWKIIATDEHGASTEGPIWSFTTRGNSPPNNPILIYPPNGSENISICADLEWNCSDPDGDDLTYDIYFGEGIPPPLTEHNWTGGTTYDPSPLGVLDFETKYFWRIIAWDEYGLSTIGDVWWFVTEANKPPNQANEPRPPNRACNVPGNVILRWNGSDPNLCDTLYYDVYFGPNPGPPKVKTKISKNSYDPDGELPLFEDFYWRIDTWDKEDLMTPGMDWTFTTGVNPPPTDPEIDCPSRWPVGVELCINITSWDPDNQTIRYIIDWGDGTINETKFYESGESKEFCHTYEKKGVYIIRVRAIDEYGAESNSEFKIVIPRTKSIHYPWFEWLIKHFPLLEVFLRIMNL